MLPRSQALKCSNFVISNWLFVILLSPPSHSPSYLVKCCVNYPESNRTGYSLSYRVRNPVSYLVGYPAGYRASYSPENPTSYWENCWDSNSSGRSEIRPDNRRERNPESNRQSNGADCLQSYSADSPPDCSASYPESFDPKPVCRATSGARSRSPSEPQSESGTSREPASSRSA